MHPLAKSAAPTAGAILNGIDIRSLMHCVETVLPVRASLVAAAPSNNHEFALESRDRSTFHDISRQSVIDVDDTENGAIE